MFTDEHPKPPPLLQDSLKEIFTDTFVAVVKDLDAVTDAVGGTVSAEIAKEKLFKIACPISPHYIYHINQCNKLLLQKHGIMQFMQVWKVH